MDAPADVADDFGDGSIAVNKDGSIRKKPGPKPGTTRKAPAARAKAPGFKAPSQPKKAPGNDYRPAIVGLLQLPQMGLALVSRFVKNEKTKTALQLDGMTVGIHSGNMAEAINTTAQHDEKLAAVLEKLATIGPYSLVISAIMVPVVQVLANHGMVAPNAQMGVLGPDELLATAQAMAG